MSWDSADVILGARAVQRNGVVASGVCCQGISKGARIVRRLVHHQCIVRARRVFEHQFVAHNKCLARSPGTIVDAQRPLLTATNGVVCSQTIKWQNHHSHGHYRCNPKFLLLHFFL